VAERACELSFRFTQRLDLSLETTGKSQHRAKPHPSNKGWRKDRRACAEWASQS
jgi:hypothetical protein